jgi:hypothetical protein
MMAPAASHATLACPWMMALTPLRLGLGSRSSTVIETRLIAVLKHVHARDGSVARYLVALERAHCAQCIAYASR